MYWFRYLGEDNLRVGTSTLAPREVYSISYNYTKKLFIVTQENSKDSSIVTESSFVDSLLLTSRGLTNKDTIKRPTAAKIIEATKANVPDEPEQGAEGNKFKVSMQAPTVSGGRPPIPKSFPIPIAFAAITVRTATSKIDPIREEFRETVETAMHYLGSKHIPQSRKFMIGESVQSPTCLLRVVGKDGKQLAIRENYIILNFPQLKKIAKRASVDVACIAQVITHEYAHYKFSGGVVKQSDILKFRKLLGARGLHPDIFNHPGYDYPWYEEAWAVLCEYMVHGDSFRGLASNEGWEIAAKYFDNNYIKGGIPTGAPLIKIR